MKLLEICFWLIIVFLVVPLYINMGLSYSSDRVDNPEGIGGLDFKAYYMAAQLAREGQDFYDWRLELEKAQTHGIAPDASLYIYPPPFVLLVMAFAALSFEMATRVWFMANLILLFITLAILVRAFNINRGVPVWLMGAFLFTPVMYNLHMGQANIIVLFLITIAYVLFKQHGEARGGIAIGLATLVKVSPGALAAYLLWKGRYRASLAALAVVILLSLVGVLVLETWGVGLSSYARYLTQVLPELGARPNPHTHSFNGLFSLMFLASPNFTPLINSPVVWRIMMVSCTLLLISATVWLCPRGNGRAMDLEMALVVTALQPVAGVTWMSTLVLLLFPYAALTGRLLRRPNRLIIALGALCFVLINLERVLELISLWQPSWPWAFGMAWLTKLPLFGALALWAAVAVAIRDERRLIDDG
jgi:hypothetical protein